LYGATLGLEAATGLWSLTAFGENLADTDYATLQAAGASPLTAPGAPRTYGVRLTLRH
jgi:hypothetical protein